VNVCTITANVYPPDFGTSVEQEQRKYSGYGGEGDSTTTISHTQDDNNNNNNKNNNDDDNNDNDEIMDPKQQKQQHKTIAYQHGAESTSILHGILDNVTITGAGGRYALSSKVNIPELAAICQSLWIQCSSTKFYTLNAQKYSFEYHVYVVLYKCITGYRVDYNCITLIPALPVIQKYLPPIKKLKNIKVSKYTKTNKIFIRCMDELYPAGVQKQKTNKLV
jgi:hypothetical protein